MTTTELDDIATIKAVSALIDLNPDASATTKAETAIRTYLAAIGAGGQTALAASPAPVPDAVRADWQRIDDALVSCASLIRALASDDVATVAAAELDYVRSALAASHTPVGDGYVLVPREIIDRFPEINPSNYTHDDACELNSWGVEVVLAAARAGEDEP